MKNHKNALAELEAAINLPRKKGRIRDIRNAFQKYKSAIKAPFWVRIWRFLCESGIF